MCACRRGKATTSPAQTNTKMYARAFKTRQKRGKTAERSHDRLFDRPATDVRDFARMPEKFGHLFLAEESDLLRRQQRLATLDLVPHVTAIPHNATDENGMERG